MGLSPSAEDITKLRLTEEVDAASNLFNPLTDVIVRKDAPERTDNAEEIAIQQHLPAYQTHKPELFGRQEGKCNGCQYPFHYRNLTVDHIIPQSIVKDVRVVTPDEVSEEEVDRRINETDWQKIIIKKLCEYYPDAKEVENGLHIPRLKATIYVPDITFPPEGLNLR
ncbi:MAG: hypothetical protein OXC79_04945 [Candidatus Poribacteria bacterium]|nr:hypothetical protein [Candidatus Poribacteria bacterium]